jgi:hypothetical protein
MVNSSGKTPFDVAREHLGDDAEALIQLFQQYKYVQYLSLEYRHIVDGWLVGWLVGANMAGGLAEVQVSAR